MPQLSLRQQLAQRIIIRISAEDYFSSEDRRRFFRRLVRDEGIGGVCVFQSNAVETAAMLKELQQIASASAAAIPLMVCADFEHGVAMRLVGGTAFPHARNLGEGDDPKMTFRVAQAIAKEAAMLGVHWNFAPVCDVNVNPANPVIGNRVFGDMPERVMRHASEYIRGTQSVGVLACAKHFPGHGDTATDSHDTLPVLAFDRDRLERVELLPFRAALQAGVKSVMVGHLAVSALEDEPQTRRPASLSRSIIANVLREQMGFDGIIITDALDMKAVTERYPAEASEQAVVEALAAGADIALMPVDPLAALNAAEQAAQSGLLSAKETDAAVERILEAKRWCGLWTGEASANVNLGVVQDVEVQTRRAAAQMTEETAKHHQLLALEAAKKGLHWYDGSGSVSDVQPIGMFNHIAGFAFVDDDDAQIGAATSFFRYLAQNFQGNCDFGFVDAAMEEADLASFVAGTQDAEAIVLAVFARPVQQQKEAAGQQVHYPPHSPWLSGRLNDIAHRLASNKPVVAVLFGNPELRHSFPRPPATAYCCTFSAAEPALGAAAFELAQTEVEARNLD